MTTDRTIENPTADQLEAGGTISGFAYGDLFAFTDKVIQDGKYSRLYIAGGDGSTATVRYPDGRIPSFINITSYTPPEPKPWWETCDDDVMIEADWFDGRAIHSARWWRKNAVDRPLSERRPRHVLVADADTEAVVALDKLRLGIQRRADIHTEPTR